MPVYAVTKRSIKLVIPAIDSLHWLLAFQVMSTRKRLHPGQGGTRAKPPCPKNGHIIYRGHFVSTMYPSEYLVDENNPFRNSLWTDSVVVICKELISYFKSPLKQVKTYEPFFTRGSGYKLVPCTIVLSHHRSKKVTNPRYTMLVSSIEYVAWKCVPDFPHGRIHAVLSVL